MSLLIRHYGPYLYYYNDKNSPESLKLAKIINLWLNKYKILNIREIDWDEQVQRFRHTLIEDKYMVFLIFDGEQKLKINGMNEDEVKRIFIKLIEYHNIKQDMLIENVGKMGFKIPENLSRESSYTTAIEEHIKRIQKKKKWLKNFKIALPSEGKNNEITNTKYSDLNSFFKTESNNTPIERKILKYKRKRVKTKSLQQKISEILPEVNTLNDDNQHENYYKNLKHWKKIKLGKFQTYENNHKSFSSWGRKKIQKSDEKYKEINLINGKTNIKNLNDELSQKKTNIIKNTHNSENITNKIIVYKSGGVVMSDDIAFNNKILPQSKNEPVNNNINEFVSRNIEEIIKSRIN